MPTFRPNRTKENLKRGDIAVGTWLQTGSPLVARLLAAQGCFQWILVDLEHSPCDPSALMNILPAISDLSQGAVTPLVRVGTAQMQEIKHALDAGAQGIIAPMVRSAAEVEDAVRYAKYPPRGLRGGGGMLSHYGHGVGRIEYMKHANDEVLVGVQIETAEALAAVDEIAAVPGLDVLFIGPNDLHMALGLPPKFWSDLPEFTEAVARIRAAAARHDLALGTLCADATSLLARREDGFKFLGLGSDAHFMLTKAGEEFGAWSGDAPPPDGWCNRLRLTGDS
ncbi:MAG: aldolase/citrate lyase family protein [Myxococcota bacterium]